ncbi:hypothetical protein G9A89_016538 [Geosiphon pyriformis]|nr:hypothetical protein G9A89_016538 [Geosiphon pyriformis]
MAVTTATPFASKTPALDILQLLGYDDYLIPRFPLPYGNNSPCESSQDSSQLIDGLRDNYASPSNSPSLNLDSSVSHFSLTDIDPMLASLSIETSKMVQVSFSERFTMDDAKRLSSFVTNLDKFSTMSKSNEEINVDTRVLNIRTETSNQVKNVSEYIASREKSARKATIFDAPVIDLKSPFISNNEQESRKHRTDKSDDEEDITTDMVKRFRSLSTDTKGKRRAKEEQIMKKQINELQDFPLASLEEMERRKVRVPSRLRSRLHVRKTYIPFELRESWTGSLEGFTPLI